MILLPTGGSIDWSRWVFQKADLPKRFGMRRTQPLLTRKPQCPHSVPLFLRSNSTSRPQLPQLLVATKVFGAGGVKVRAGAGSSSFSMASKTGENKDSLSCIPSSSFSWRGSVGETGEEACGSLAFSFEFGCSSIRSKAGSSSNLLKTGLKLGPSTASRSSWVSQTFSGSWRSRLLFFPWTIFENHRYLHYLSRPVRKAIS